MKEETKLKISNALKGRMPKNIHLLKTREVIEKSASSKRGKPFSGTHSNWNGKKHSEESKVKMSIARKGIKLSAETRKKIGEANIGSKSHLWKGGITSSYINRRREYIKKNGGFHSNGEWENLKAQYNWTCPCCKKEEPEIKLTKDHIIPVTKGGSSNIENIQPLCFRCNSSKNNKSSIRYEIF